MATLKDIFEALNMAQRLKKARQMKMMQPRLKIAIAKAKKRTATREVLMKRARKHARKLLLKKLLKGIDKSDLSMARKQEIEKRLDTPAMKSKIEKLAMKLLPKMKKMEMERKKGSSEEEKKND